jgi:hypothetical protein
LAEGRPLADQLGIDHDRPDSFAFVAKLNLRYFLESTARMPSGSGRLLLATGLPT